MSVSASGRLVGLDGLKVSITGVLSEERASVARKLKRCRATFQNHISSDLDVLVQGKPSGREKWSDVSTKLNEVLELRALGHKIFIINESELDRLLAGESLEGRDSRAALAGPVSSAGIAYRSSLGKDRSSSIRGKLQIDLDKLERSTNAHHRLVDEVAAAISSEGLVPLSPVSADCAFDVAWEKGATLHVVEVKTIDGNESQQMRLGLGQVLEYRESLRTVRRRVRAHLVVSKPPGADRVLRACEATDVDVLWPGCLEGLFSSR